MDVVVVESPAKAKTINKYLGSGYKVLASYGHIRDLPARDGSVRPDADFDMSWEVDARAEKHLKEIASALKGADRLFLATDPDREGEAISWHVREVLKSRKALDAIEVSRVVFHEVTKDAVLEAMRNPRAIDAELVDAYLARRALDYLVGFTLSPVLWRKLPGSRSAGRVQSVALRLICDREAEIEAFVAREFWTVDGAFRTPADARFTARLTHIDGRKLDRFDLANAETANTAAERVRAGSFRVGPVERRMVSRNPQPPFTTSTLQQEASRKLGLSASRTMRVAQMLYEGVDIGGESVGLISYMRTDSVQLSREAISASRALIARDYGDAYVPESPRVYRSKAKNAQEAHEAIRPTDLFRRPAEVARFLDRDAARLYELIWTRTVASAMESARLEQVSVDVADGAGTTLHATGSIVRFDGFLKLYREGRDDEAEDDEAERRLPDLKEGDALTLETVTPEQHFTKPPPRFTEASLVKMLEELGIGRPSTYASILTVLQERNYVRLDARRFVAEDRGRLVTAFLSGFFSRYVQNNFTAEMEDKLDDISNGQIEWKSVLRDFWQAFSQAVENTKDLTIREVLDALDRDLGPHFFPDRGDGADPRLCPACASGRLGLKLGRHGAFIGCSNYPSCAYTRPLAVAGAGEAEAVAAAGPKLLGEDPESGLPVTLRKGPYGYYVQLGEASDDKKEVKPKRAALPKSIDPATLTLEPALGLLSLPRQIGLHPESGEPVIAGIGRFGPYLKHQSTFVSIPADESVLDIGLNRAVDLIAAKAQNRRGGEVLRELGPHPADGKAITLYRGRYGPYVKHGRINATIPKGSAEDAVTLDQAVALLAAQAAKKGKKPARAKAPAKAPTGSAGAARAKSPARQKTKKAKAAKGKTAKAGSKAKGASRKTPTAEPAAGGD